MEEGTYDLISTRPYLVRAIREWTIDNGLTPQLLIDATVDGVNVPPEYVKEGRIVLNIDPGAVVDLHLGNQEILFATRFQGRSLQVTLPLSSVMAIFARENNQGLFFRDESSQIGQSGEQEVTQEVHHDRPREGPRPNLKLVE